MFADYFCSFHYSVEDDTKVSCNLKRECTITKYILAAGVIYQPKLEIRHNLTSYRKSGRTIKMYRT